MLGKALLDNNLMMAAIAPLTSKEESLFVAESIQNH
jgi:hypothetical protein